MSVDTSIPTHDATVLYRQFDGALSKPFYSAAPLVAPTAEQQQLRTFSRRALPIAQRVSAQSVTELSHLPTPTVWAEACDDYELARTSYAVDILGLDEYNGFGLLWTETRNNIEPIYALCKSAYDRYTATSSKTSAFAPSKVWDSYFAALSAVVLQYWAFVNRRLFTYAPHKRGIARLFKQSMPDTMLLVYMSTDFEPVLLAKTAASAAEGAEEEEEDEAEEAAEAKEQKEEAGDEKAEKAEEAKDADMATAAPETIESFAGRQLVDLVRDRSFADALLLVGAHYVELDADVFRMLSVFVLNTVARSTRLFLTSRGFNFFPWADIEAIVKPAATRQLRTSHTQRVAPIPRTIVHWYPQQPTLAMERLVLPVQSTPTQVGAKMIPHLCAHARLSAFEPIFDVQATCGVGASEVACVASLLAQLRWFVPCGLDYTRILRGSPGETDARLSDISARLRGPALVEVVQYLLNPVAHRYRFVVFSGFLLLQPPLQLRHREAVVTERSPLSITASLLAFAAFAISHRDLVFVSRSSYDAVSPRLFYFVHAETRSVRHTTAPRDTTPVLDAADSAVVLAFADVDQQPVSEARVYEFFRAAVILARGDPVLTCALCMRYLDPDLSASPARVARLLHAQYRAFVRQHVQFAENAVGPARDVVRYIRTDWDRLSPPCLRLQTSQMHTEILDSTTAQWLASRVKPVPAVGSEAVDVFSACVDVIRLLGTPPTHPDYLYFVLAAEGSALERVAPFSVGAASFPSWAALRRFVEGFARHFVQQLRSFCILAAQPLAVEWVLRPADAAALDQFKFMFSDVVQRVAPFARARPSMLPADPMAPIERSFYQFWKLLGAGNTDSDAKSTAAVVPPSRAEILQYALPDARASSVSSSSSSSAAATQQVRDDVRKAIGAVLKHSCRISRLEVHLVEKSLYPDEKARARVPLAERAREVVSVLRDALVEFPFAAGRADAWTHFRWSAATKDSDPLVQAVHDQLQKLPARHGLPSVDTVDAHPTKRRARGATTTAVAAAES